MRLAVIGSKEFHDHQKLKSILDIYLGITVIVSGAAAGTDSLAARYANEHNIRLLEFTPEYNKYGAETKHVRDRLIVENCDQLIAFWDGKCEGTKYTMSYAKQLKKPIKIIDV